MRVIFNRSTNALYTQQQVDALIEDALATQSRRRRYSRDLDKLIDEALSAARPTSHELRTAWQKYEKQFGNAPRGTEKQLRALLELIPARVREMP